MHFTDLGAIAQMLALVFAAYALGASRRDASRSICSSSMGSASKLAPSLYRTLDASAAS
jgi:hypothetical protein